jgi:hypothetical protein
MPFEDRDPSLHAIPEKLKGKVPNGHLKPLGHPDFYDSWAGSIDVLEEEPDPQTFWTHYWPKKPFLLKNFAKRSPAFTKWRDDDYLLKNFGQFKAKCEPKNEDRLTDYCNQVKFGKMVRCGKDTIPYTELHMKIKKFLPKLRDPKFDKYIITQMPDAMAPDFVVPSFHSCAKRDSFDPGPEGHSWMTQMYENNFWLSHNDGRNFSTSVIHYDMNHQLMCLFEGTKEWIMWDLSTEAENIPMWSQYYDKRRHDAQGSDDSPIDGERVDLERWPGFAKARWMNATMEAGDCLYTPALLLHYVRSWGRNVAGMSMFQREERYDSTCGGAKQWEPKPLSAYDVMWSFPEEDPSLLGWNMVKMGFPNWKRQFLWPLSKIARKSGGQLSKKDFMKAIARFAKSARGLRDLKKRTATAWTSMDPKGVGSVAAEMLFKSKELRFLLKDVAIELEGRDSMEEDVEVDRFDLQGDVKKRQVEL